MPRLQDTIEDEDEPRATSSRHSLTMRSKSRDVELTDDDDGASARRKRGHVPDDSVDPSRGGSRRRTREPTSGSEDIFDQYDPDQSIEERRDQTEAIRALARELNDNPDKFLKADAKPLMDFWHASDAIAEQIKQPGVAAIDSRNIVKAADLTAKRVQKYTSGNLGGGVDVDEFVSKCITFMLTGGDVEDDELSSTQQHRRHRGGRRSAIDLDGDEDEDENGDMYNWVHLGRHAVLPSIRRPALTGFLLGPLSVEKKARKITKRSAPLKLNKLKEVRPQELRAEDFENTEKNDVTALVRKIHAKLEAVQVAAQERAEEMITEDTPEDEVERALDKCALGLQGAVCLMRFVINPHSFGQTVENIFYVSFLIKEGSAELIFEENGLPYIQPTPKPDADEGGSQDQETGRRDKSKRDGPRHQGIMSIDMETWRDLIEAYDIKEPMIDHREETSTAGPGARSWYT